LAGIVNRFPPDLEGEKKRAKLLHEKAELVVFRIKAMLMTLGTRIGREERVTTDFRLSYQKTCVLTSLIYVTHRELKEEF